MTAQVEELLDMAYIRTGQPLTLQRQSTDLVSLTQRVLAAYQQTTDRHQLLLETDGAQTVGEWDAPRLERILGNLLSNAIKYSPDGGDICVFTRVVYEGDQPWAVLQVGDQGMGIPAIDLPNLFQPFHRSGNVVGKITGTGLGLAAVKQIVEQHGGTVAVESAEGQGSTFTIRLPL